MSHSTSLVISDVALPQVVELPGFEAPRGTLAGFVSAFTGHTYGPYTFKNVERGISQYEEKETRSDYDDWGDMGIHIPGSMTRAQQFLISDSPQLEGVPTPLLDVHAEEPPKMGLPGFPGIFSQEDPPGLPSSSDPGIFKLLPPPKRKGGE